MMPHDISSIFTMLEGQWSVRREIISRGLSGTFTGTAQFSTVTDTILSYQEHGILDFNGYHGEASRKYQYHLKDRKIYIHYDDGPSKGDILHELEFLSNGAGALCASHCHQCGQDFYQLDMTVTRPENHITMSYTVKGANKDYRMVSVLTAH